MDKYLLKNSNLMARWMDSRPDGVIDFVSDGIVHPKTWFETSGEKILFLLKEAYTKQQNKEWDLAKWLAGEKCMEECNDQCSTCWPAGHTYNHVAEQAYMILNQTEKFDEWLGVEKGSRLNYLHARREILKRVAIVNIKKYSGTKSSNNKVLQSHVDKYRTLLKEQLEIIQPTVIVCGGTYEYLQQILNLHGLEDPKDGVDNYKGIRIIATHHPNQRISSRKKAEEVAKKYFSPVEAL